MVSISHLGVLSVLTQQTELSQSNTHMNLYMLYLNVRNKIHKDCESHVYCTFMQRDHGVFDLQIKNKTKHALMIMERSKLLTGSHPSIR